VHRYPINRIIYCGDQIFDIKLRILQAMIQGKCAVLATTPIEDAIHFNE